MTELRRSGLIFHTTIAIQIQSFETSTTWIKYRM